MYDAFCILLAHKPRLVIGTIIMSGGVESSTTRCTYFVHRLFLYRNTLFSLSGIGAGESDRMVLVFMC